MTMTSPFVVVLTDDERAALIAQTRPSEPFRRVLRARIVLAAGHGETNTAIAATLGVTPDTVRKWRARFCRERLPGLRDRPRSGRPRRFTPLVVAEVRQLACTLPAESDVPLSRWSCAELATEAVARGHVDSISASTVRRWLAADAIKPWQHRSWIFPRDPQFAVKASQVLDLYARRWQDRPLGDDEFVICADEKSQLQALRRRHATLPCAPGRAARIEFEYRRGGTLAYLAAYDVHRAQVIGRCAPTTGIAPFADLVEQVMTSEPYASARRVFWIVDNGSSHNGAASLERMHRAWPTCTLLHLPIHASWLNQVEIYFSVVQRKVINPADFTDLTTLIERLLAFQNRYNTAAKPFDWKFTRDDLHALLHKIPDTQPANNAPAA